MAHHRGDGYESSADLHAHAAGNQLLDLRGCEPDDKPLLRLRLCPLLQRLLSPADRRLRLKPHEDFLLRVPEDSGLQAAVQ